MVFILAPRRGIEPRTNRLTETLDAEKLFKINDLKIQKSLCNCSCNCLFVSLLYKLEKGSDFTFIELLIQIFIKQ